MRIHDFTLPESGSGGVSPSEYFMVADVVPSGSTSGGAIQNTWNTRRLNTVVQEMDGASLDPATGIVTLPAGIYTITGLCAFFACGDCTHRLYKVTGDGVITEWPTDANSSGMSTLKTDFTLDDASELAMQFFSTGSTSSSARQGLQISAKGTDEVYTHLIFEKRG